MEKEKIIKLDELIKQEIKNNFTNNLMETLNSAFIFKYVQTLETQLKKQKEINKKAIEYIKSKENGKCIHNGIEKGAYTFVLDFDKAREFIWELLQILEDKGE